MSRTNLRRIKASVKVALREFFRSKSAVFFVVLFPIMLMVLFGFIFSGQEDVSYALPVQNLDAGSQGANFTAVLNESGFFIIEEVSPAEDANDWLIREKQNTILIIPENYSAELENILMLKATGQPVNDTASLIIMYDPSNTAAQSKKAILSSFVDGMNKEFSGVEDVVAMDPQLPDTIPEEFKAVDFYAPGIIAMAVMSASLFGTVGMNIELRQKGILRKLATTPLTMAEWLVANITYQMVMAGISTTAILASGYIVFGLSPHINIWVVIFIMLNVFAFSGTGMLITRFVTEAESAQAATNAIMFPMMFLSGTFFPLEIMPDFLSSIAKFLPLYYVNEGLRASMITQEYSTVWSSLAVIFVFAMVVFILGVFLTTWKDD